jgi:hypothetical protein
MPMPRLTPTLGSSDRRPEEAPVHSIPVTAELITAVHDDHRRQDAHHRLAHGASRTAENRRSAPRNRFHSLLHSLANGLAQRTA